MIFFSLIVCYSELFQISSFFPWDETWYCAYIHRVKINGFSKKACYFSKVLEGCKNIFEQEASISGKKKLIYFLKVGLSIVFFIKPVYLSLGEGFRF